MARWSRNERGRERDRSNIRHPHERPEATRETRSSRLSREWLRSEPSWRELEELATRRTDRIFKITEQQRQHVAQCLRYIDEARRTLEAQQNADNREIIRELRASADKIYDLMSELEEL
jgi:hypothetical protein